MQFIIKVMISALIIGLVSEIAKRSTSFAAIVASLPLTSMLAFVWLYYDTKDAGRIIELSHNILWAVIPSLLFFIVFPLLLKMGIRFSFAIGASSIIMFLGYTLYTMLLNKFGIPL